MGPAPAGSASGREPTVTVESRSYLGQFLQESGVTLGAEVARARADNQS